LFKGPVAISYD